MKTRIFSSLIFALAFMGALTSGFADPQLASWYTANSGRYARIYTNTASENSGSYVNTWSNGTETQSLPAYSGVQEIDYSTDWIYIRSTGLGFHIMGPWYLNAAKTQIFPNYPINTQTFTRIPRSPTVPTSKTAT